MQVNRSNPTFANILPELFETHNTSPRKPFDDSGAYSLHHQNSIKTEDYAAELMNKLRDKNNELEKAKLELETKLRDTEQQKKNFEMAFNNSDRLLAEKERFIANMNTEKIKTELANKNDLNDIRVLRKEISDLKEDKHALENKLAILQTTANVISASHGPVGSNPGSLRSSEDFSQANHHPQYESLNIKVRSYVNIKNGHILRQISFAVTLRFHFNVILQNNPHFTDKFHTNYQENY
jgi:predicted RNase H-like nuclease (RuvC/YqgF family)